MRYGWNDFLFAVTGVILIFIEIYSFSVGSNYTFDFIFLIAGLAIVYFIRDKIRLHPLHYFFFCLFLLMHNFGVFNLYRFKIFGIEYDSYMHAFFGFLFSLVLYRYYILLGPCKNKFKMYLVIVLFILGVSILHEVVEYVSALILGNGEGALFFGAGDMGRWDTFKDMLNNIIGGVLGIIAYELVLWSKGGSRERKLYK